ncbi:MAG: acyltransferase [Desulfobulbaceae bacterium]|nr:acyltransferase [Desulfobulbaceae bacterium]
MTQRTDWVDYAKGIGIILVVYGHLLSSGFHAGLAVPEHFFLLSDSLVYSFHMPLFFFLAGLFAGQSCRNRGVKAFLVNKLEIIAYPYLIWSFFQASVELAFASQSFRGATYGQLLAIPYLPWSQFWFLYALLAMYVAFGMFSLLGKYFHVFLCITAAILFLWPINSEVMAMHGFSTGFLFFVIGVLAKEFFGTSGKMMQKTIPPVITLVFLFIFAGSGWYIFERVIAPTRLTDGSHPFYFLYLAGLGIPMCVGLAQYLAAKKWCGMLRILGRYSLQIYLVHMLAGVGARIILLNIFQVNNPLVHMIVGVGAGLTVPIFLYRVTLKMNFPYLFTWRLRATGIEGEQ